MVLHIVSTVIKFELCLEKQKSTLSDSKDKAPFKLNKENKFKVF